jgi:hypothetical protein
MYKTKLMIKLSTSGRHRPKPVSHTTMAHAAYFLVSGFPYKKDLIDNTHDRSTVLSWLNDYIKQHFAGKIKRGDVIRCIKDAYRNDGCFVWDGKRVVELYYDEMVDEYGYLPSTFVFDDVEDLKENKNLKESEDIIKVNGPDYWLNSDYGIAHNTIMWPSQRLRQEVAEGLHRVAAEEGNARFVSCLIMQDGRRFPFVFDASHFYIKDGKKVNLASVQRLILDMNIPFNISAEEDYKLSIYQMGELEFEQTDPDGPGDQLLFKEVEEDIKVMGKASFGVGEEAEPEVFGEFSAMDDANLVENEQEGEEEEDCGEEDEKDE